MVQCEVERERSVPGKAQRVSRKLGQRILGPYEERAGWRVIEVDARGTKTPALFPTEVKAQRYVEMLRAELERNEHTTETALVEYRRYLLDDKGNKDDSARQTCSLIGAFFPVPLSLAALTEQKQIEVLYEALRKQKLENGELRFSVDSHRSALIQVRTFLNWCITKGWMKTNPAIGVKGVGKRRARGKSLGKEGNELRVKQARALYEMAIYRAHRGDEGAIAVLVAMLLGMRASEIVSRRVGDLDEDTAPCDLLWIPCSKTPAGRRTLEVPEVLRPYLVALAKDKAPERYLFEVEYIAGKSKPHWRDWILHNVQRVCGLAEVPEVTAHAMRGLLATLTAERGLAGHLIAATLGHEDERTTMTAYAAPGAAAVGIRRRGLTVLDGGAHASGRNRSLGQEPQGVRGEPTKSRVQGRK